MAFCFVFVLKAIMTELALILLFRFMVSAGQPCQCLRWKAGKEGGVRVKGALCLGWPYFNSSSVKNFFGFFGQHSQM